MMNKANPKTMLAIALFVCALAAGSANAGYMEFTADSLRVEDAGGC
jgi:hypothetical protein